jgi:citrate/tricarballylate utilization protein
MLSDDLLAEAQRQLNICNSCRYCAAYCPVWPSLEQHTELAAETVVDLANLCHDCHDCYDACMYTAPHEFELNPPALFTAVRSQTYEEFAWPGKLPTWTRAQWLRAAALVLAFVLIVGVGALTTGKLLPGGTSGSAYAVVSHGALLAIFGVATVWAVLSFTMSAWTYWTQVHGPARNLMDGRAWRATLAQAATLRHQTGGGAGCDYPSDIPSTARRWWHHLVSYGFGFALIATISAAIGEYIFGSKLPYPVLSVPVITGTIGGVSMTVGCVALILLKRKSAPEQTTTTMRRADYGFLWALLILAVTGTLVMLLRHSALFSTLLAIHLAAVLVAFVVAPYTKFVHWIYRVLALYGYNLGAAGGPDTQA